MSIELPPIVPSGGQDRRQNERRKDWHTPEDCFRIADFQAALDKIFLRLKDGDERMDSIFGQLEDSKTTIGCMQDNIAGNHRIVSDDIKSLEAAMSATQKELADNTAKTGRIFEIVEMGEGFFKGVKFVGKWARKIILWVAPVVTALYALWDVITSHK